MISLLVATALLALAVVVARCARDGGRAPGMDLMSQFAAEPASLEATIFLGDSLTAEAPWAEFFPRTLNRGISGDTIDGVLSRLNEIARHRPKIVLLMIGINDVLRGGRAARIVYRIKRLLDRLKRELPTTKIFLQSLLPVRIGSTVEPRHNDTIRVINAELAAYAAGTGLEFIDLHHRFTDDEGELREELTHDGVHLTKAGYSVWITSLPKEIRE